MTHLAEVRWLSLTDVADERGRLTAVEGERDVPFPIARVFYVHHVTPGIDRGGHAHCDTDQVAVAAYGSLKVDVSDGVDTVSYTLTDPGRGLFLPRMLWVRLYGFTPGAVLLVFASTHY
ncbi:MAG: FdtA/QdtA family cupin domain-containing protein, partial [Armatimonadota bacterium]|nr:FdtA/QdtA family cupin domain-containing protein [Armatimonadota bacterium]